MQIPWQGIQGFSGAIAVGGLALTSLLLLAGVFATNLFLAIPDRHFKFPHLWTPKFLQAGQELHY
jgi:hypothetical protein